MRILYYFIFINDFYEGFNDILKDNFTLNGIGSNRTIILEYK